MAVTKEGWIDWGKNAFKTAVVATKAIARLKGPEETFEQEYNDGVEFEKNGDDIEMVLQQDRADHTKDNELKKQQKDYYDWAIEKYKVAYRGTMYIHHIPALFRLKDLLLKLVDQKKKYIHIQPVARLEEEGQKLPTGPLLPDAHNIMVQTEVIGLFKSAITKLEEFIQLAKKRTDYFKEYKEELSNDLPKALDALSELKYNGLIVNYTDSGANKTLRLIEPDYEKAYLLSLDAYNLNVEEHRHLNLLMNLAFRYYQYYLDTIKRFGEIKKTKIMLEEIKTYLRQYITEAEKVDRNKEQDDDLSEARGLLEFLERKKPSFTTKKGSSRLGSISEEEEEGEEGEEGKEGPGWGSGNWGVGGKSIKHRSIKRRSIKRRSIKRRSIKRKSKTYKKTRRNYRKTKSYYKK